MMKTCLGSLAALTVFLGACGESAPTRPSSSGQVSSSTSSSSSGDSNSSNGSVSPTGDGGAADCAGGDEGGPVPSSPAELNAWLQKRAYRCWSRESTVHASDGPHGGNVRVYLNAALDRSMKGDGEHPVGAVALKELYGSGTETVTGWAVGVKTETASNGGQGWYWYEVFSTSPNPSGSIEGQGKELCSDCHSGGKDFVLITYPLR